MNEGMSSMTDPIGHSARAAAQRLAAEHEPGLPAEVEVALHTRGSTHRPEQYLDSISLAALIVSVATLAWTIYNDQRTKTLKPSLAVAVRTIRVQLGDVSELDSAQRDRIIEIVTEETIQTTQRLI